MVELDLSTALGVRFGDAEVSAVRIADTDIWTLPVPGVEPPVFVAKYETVHDTVGTSKSTSVTVEAGDTLVLLIAGKDGTMTVNTSGSTLVGGGLSWTLRKTMDSNSSNSPYLQVWTAVSNVAQTFTLSVGATTGPRWGFTVLRFTGCVSIGRLASNPTAGSTKVTQPANIDVTTLAASSAIVLFVNDWGAVDGTGRAPRLIGSGEYVEESYVRTSGYYTVLIGHYTDSGATGLKNVGYTMPNPMSGSGIALELASVEVPQALLDAAALEDAMLAQEFEDAIMAGQPEES